MAMYITNKQNLQYLKTIVRLLKHVTVSFNYLMTYDIIRTETGSDIIKQMASKRRKYQLFFYSSIVSLVNFKF